LPDPKRSYKQRQEDHPSLAKALILTTLKVAPFFFLVADVTASLTQQLKDIALSMGFDLVGITLPQPPETLPQFLRWLGQGYAGDMSYLKNGAQKRICAENLLAGVRSLVVLAISYHQPEGRATETPQLYGRVATYASGQDYHDLLWSKLHHLSNWLKHRVPGSETRGIVDTAPFLERDFARSAGLGWFGKNAMLINKQLGSYFFIATLLTTVELDPDPPHLAAHCGTCTACLDACPTNAFPEPGVLDATKCISYLTIELKKPIPQELRRSLGNWAFGCDICQDVCPWNRKAPPGKEAALLPSSNQGNTLDLIELLMLNQEQFRNKFRHTAIWRTRRRGLLRNAAIVLGNQRDPRAIPALIHALADDEPVIRGAAAWSLGQFNHSEAKKRLEARLLIETDQIVQQEIKDALRPSGH
jgi:epoxyqueuosine reductase